MRIATTSLLLLAAAALAPAQDGKRLAVIIGNDNYPARPLKNAVNDARLMDKALQAAGFRTILRENARKAEMEEAMVELVEKLGPDDTALFFYAGHGVQIESENFLVPVDFESATSMVRAKSMFFGLPYLFDYLKRSRARRTIVILDACRNNPVSESLALQAGLAIPLNAASESFIAFSTSPNHVATDNPNGRNSWFTEAVGDLIAQPGLTIEEVFMRAGKRVKDATGEKQTPWVHSSLTSKFFFHAPAGGGIEIDATSLEKWMDDARIREQRADWPEAIRLVTQVLARKPGGQIEAMAKAKLPYLTARRDAQAQYDASQFAAAAKLNTQAVALDAFATDAAFQGVNSYMLADQLDDAVALLKIVRMRGASAAVAKADAMLKELAAVHPPSAEELKAVRQPPPLTEVLTAFRFGVPDQEAGKRYMERNTIDLAGRAAELAAMYPPPPPPQITVAQPVISADNPAGAVTLESLHLEVVSAAETRDLRARRTTTDQVNTAAASRPTGVKVKVSTDPPGADLTIEGDAAQTCQSPCILTLEPARAVVRARMPGYQAAMHEFRPDPAAAEVQLRLEPEFGFVQFPGLEDSVSVLVNGKPAPRTQAGRLQLPVGKYFVQLVESGKVLSRGDLEITPLTTVAMPVRNVP
jgi:hypothetical protein